MDALNARQQLTVLLPAERQSPVRLTAQSRHEQWRIHALRGHVWGQTHVKKHTLRKYFRLKLQTSLFFHNSQQFWHIIAAKTQVQLIPFDDLAYCETDCGTAPPLAVSVPLVLFILWQVKMSNLTIFIKKIIFFQKTGVAAKLCQMWRYNIHTCTCHEKDWANKLPSTSPVLIKSNRSKKYSVHLENSLW